MKELPDTLRRIANDVQAIIDQVEACQMRYAGLEAQLRILQNDLWASENELREMRKAMIEK